MENQIDEAVLLWRDLTEDEQTLAYFYVELDDWLKFIKLCPNTKPSVIKKLWVKLGGDVNTELKQ